MELLCYTVLMGKHNTNSSNRTLYAIAIGMLLLVLANILVGHFSDNVWRNLGVGVLLAVVLSLVVYMAVKRDEERV